MSFKILERNGVDNENIDGAAFNNFAAGERDGIVAGVLSQCSIYYDGNVIGISSGELIIHGFRIKITETETISVSSTPVTATKYQIIAQIVCGDNNDVSFSIFVRLPSVLKKDEIFKNNRGTYQMEFGTFVHNPDGRVTELTRTASVFYSDIHNSAILAEQAAKVAEESAENALIAAEKAVMDIPMSEEKISNFVNCENTLDGAKTNFELESENLLLFPYDDIDGRVDNGITYTINSDGSVTLNGTATGNSSFTFSYDKQILLAGIYTFSCKNSTNEIRFAIRVKNSPVLYITGTPKTSILNSFYTFNQISIVVLSGTVCNNVTVYPKIQYGEIATEYTRYVSAGTKAEITACGKNLIPFPYYKSNDTINGITWTINEDGTVTANGTATENSIFQIRNFDFSLASGTYCASGALGESSSGSGNYNIQIATENYAQAWNVTNNTIITLNKTEILLVQLVVYNGTTVNNYLFKPQIEYNTISTSYVKYQGQNYTSQVGQTVNILQYDKITNIFSNTDGVAIKGKLALSTQYELNTKPVSLSGTFADRPTGTYPYIVIYTATDKQDDTRTTRLEANTDGSLSDNWVKISSNESVKEEIDNFYQAQTAINAAFENVTQQLASDIVTSEQETGAFINGQNTLKDVMASVEVQSKNLADLSKNPITGGKATIVERTDNSITFRVDESVTSLYQGFSLDGITEGEITASAEWVTSGSGDPALALWWHYNRTFPNEGLVAFTKTSGGAITAKLKKPTEDAVLYIMLYVTRDIPAVIGDTTTFTNVLVERGNTKTSWTPYLPAGTPVNITACGKNLFDETKSEPLKIGLSLTVNEDKTINYKGTPDATYSYPDVNYRFRIPVLKSGTIPILYTTWENAPTSVVSIVLYGKDKTTLVGNFNSVTNTGWQEAQARLTDDAYYAGLFFGRLTAGTPTEINNIRLALVADSSIPSEPYPTYQGQDYSSQVGQTVDVVQYDKVTNIFATTEGGAVSTQFLLSTKYELEDKVNLLVGTFANRPTTTQKYGLIYIATDQTGANRVTYLPPNTDGIVSGNWISFNS